MYQIRFLEVFFVNLLYIEYRLVLLLKFGKTPCFKTKVERESVEKVDNRRATAFKKCYQACRLKNPRFYSHIYRRFIN